MTLTGTGVNLTAYPLVADQGAVMNLSGINTLSGNILLNSQVGLGVEQIFDNTTGTPVLTDNYSATNNVASQLTLGGTQSGVGGGINKLGSQRLTIQGPGTYTGAVNIDQGVLLIENNTALGIGGGTTTVVAGTALELGNTITTEDGGLQGGLDIAGEALVLNGSGDSTFNDTAPLDLLPAGLNPIPTSNLFSLLAAGTNPFPSSNSFNLTAGPFDDPILGTDSTWGGNITLNNSLTIDLGPNTRLTLNGVISDSGTGDGIRTSRKRAAANSTWAGPTPTRAPPSSPGACSPC